MKVERHAERAVVLAALPPGPRRVDALGALSLVLIVLSVAASLISGDARFALIKESLITGVFGTIGLGSPFLGPRPLMFYFGRQFSTGGDCERSADGTGAGSIRSSGRSIGR